MRRTVPAVIAAGLFITACGPEHTALVYRYYGRRGDTPEALARRLGTAAAAKSWEAYQGRDAATPFRSGELLLIPSETLNKKGGYRDALALAANGRRRVARGDLAAGIADLEAARGILPEDPAVLYDLGVAYLDAAEYTLAVERLGRAHSLVPQDEEVTLALSLSYLALGADAAAAWESLTPVANEDPFPLVARGEVHAALQQWVPARHFYFSYLKAAPTGPWADIARKGVRRTAREELANVKSRQTPPAAEAPDGGKEAPREAGVER